MRYIVGNKLISFFLAVIICSISINGFAARKGDERHTSGEIQQLSVKDRTLSINNKLYTIAPYAKISDGGKPIKLRHLSDGEEVRVIFKERKKADLPEIIHISVVIK